MKKVLLFGAAILTAMSMSAKVYNFGGIQASDITTDGTIGTYTMDGVEIPSVSAGADADINCTLNGMEDLVINYKNSSGKDNILKFAADYHHWQNEYPLSHSDKKETLYIFLYSFVYANHHYCTVKHQ